MTFLAGGQQWFEVKQAIVTVLQRTMTSCAGHPFVPSLEGKAATGFMIELFGQPIHRHMALITGDLTVRGHPFGKLTPVDILMTAGAMQGRCPKTYTRFRLGVAVQTDRHGMPSFQGKAGGPVVEIHRVPASLIVARPAATFGHELVRLTEMGILVAIGAGVMSGSQVRRAARIPGLMARDTWGGPVGTVQRKGGRGMLFHRIPGGTEPLHGMTVFADHQTGFGQPGAVMAVAVAIPASGELRFFPFLRMTTRAGHPSVPTLKRIPGCRMVKGRPLNQKPAGGGMALTAIGTQGPCVGIAVAIGARGVGKSRKYLWGAFAFGNMALGAVNGLMFAFQGKSGLFVVEQGRGPPGVGIVARSAGAGLLRLSMYIRVTRSAGRVKTQIRASKVLAHRFQSAGINDVPGIMALPTFELGVPAGLFETHGSVVEAFGTFGPVDQIVFFSLMFYVAVHTIFEITPRMHP